MDEPSNTPENSEPTDDRSASRAAEMQDRFIAVLDRHARANQRRLEWLSRPRLHLAVFDDLERAERAERIANDPLAKSASPEVRRAIDGEKERGRKAKEALKTFGWTAQRFSEFKKLALAYRKEPSIKHYLSIRTEFPELDIQIGMSGGIDPLFAIEDKCRQCGIDPELVAGAMDGFEPDIDELCLILMERIVAREQISGAGTYQRRQAAISDAMVNYLIAFMLEGLDWCGDEVRMPASLILLIRHQLGPLKGDFHKEYKSREAMDRAAWIAGQQLQPNEKLSINRLIKLASTADIRIPRSTAARWLKDPEFQKKLKFSVEFDEARSVFQQKK